MVVHFSEPSESLLNRHSGRPHCPLFAVHSGPPLRLGGPSSLQGVRRHSKPLIGNRESPQKPDGASFPFLPKRQSARPSRSLLSIIFPSNPSNSPHSSHHRIPARSWGIVTLPWVRRNMLRVPGRLSSSVPGHGPPNGSPPPSIISCRPSPGDRHAMALFRLPRHPRVIHL